MVVVDVESVDPELVDPTDEHFRWRVDAYWWGELDRR